MNLIQEYINSTIKFTNSLIFKLELHRKYLNNLWYKLYNYNPSSPEEEKYYLNLSGRKAPYDPDVYIFDTSAGNYVIFDKTYLDNNIDVKNKLLEYGNEYKQLIQDNPYMTTYINGLLHPIDIEKAINADDGDLLYYNTDFINENELYLVNEIENFVKKILYTYNVKEYTIDEFYIHALTSNIYSNLPLFIISKRISNLLTYKADIFNMMAHITSFGGLDKDQYDFMNLKSLIWLYGNRNYIKTNIGKNIVLDNILDNVYATNKIGVNKLKLTNNEPTIIEDNVNDPTKNLYEKNEYYVTVKANQYGSNDKSYQLENILEIEQSNGYMTKEISDNLLEKYKNILNYNSVSTITKDLIFDNSELILIKYLTTIELLVPIYLSTVNLDNFKPIIAYQNPINNKRYTFDKYQLTIMYLYGILTSLNMDTNIRIDKAIITCDYTITPAFENIADSLYNKDLVKPYYDYIVSLKNNIPEIVEISDLYTVLNYISDILFKIKVMVSNIEEPTIKHDVINIVNSLFPDNEITINNEGLTIYNYVEKYYPDLIGLTPDDAKYLMRDMSEKLFNINVDERVILDDIFRKYINVGSVYKSYTIKYLYDPIDSTDLYSSTLSNYVFSNTKSSFKLKDARYKRYNDVIFYYNSITYPLNDIGPLEYDISVYPNIITSILKPKLDITYNKITRLDDTLTVSIMRLVDKYSPDVRTIYDNKTDTITYVDEPVIPNTESYTIEEKSLTSNNHDENYIREIEPIIIIHK